MNTWAFSIHVVRRNKPKRRSGLSQKGTVAGTGAPFSPVMDRQRDRRTEGTSPMLGNPVERGKPVSPLARREGDRKGNRR